MDMQKNVSNFVKTYKLDIPVHFRLLDLISEMGELSKEVLKSTNYAKKPFCPNDEWKEELGDVLFSLICVADSTGVDIEKALSAVLEKYKKRIESKHDAGSGR